MSSDCDRQMMLLKLMKNLLSFNKLIKLLLVRCSSLNELVSGESQRIML